MLDGIVRRFVDKHALVLKPPNEPSQLEDATDGR